MNSILEEIYSTIIPSAPYIIAAYALVVVVLFIFLFAQYRKLAGLERKVQLLEEASAEAAGEGEAAAPVAEVAAEE